MFAALSAIGGFSLSLVFGVSPSTAVIIAIACLLVGLLVGLYVGTL